MKELVEIICIKENRSHKTGDRFVIDIVGEYPYYFDLYSPYYKSKLWFVLERERKIEELLKDE